MKPACWEGEDGTGGLHKQLTNHGGSLSQQISATINRMIHPEGRELASLCLQLSFGFLEGLTNFISRWYHQLVRTKVYSDTNCWTLVYSCASWIFDELHLMRASTRHAYIASDPAGTCNTYTWAVLHAHGTMAKFMRYKFGNHLAMLAAITKFAVCNSPITPTSALKEEVERPKRIMSLLMPLADQLKTA